MPQARIDTAPLAPNRLAFAAANALQDSRRSVSIRVHSWLRTKGVSELFQKEIHAVEVNERMIIVERIDSQNTADSGAALLQREIW